MKSIKVFVILFTVLSCRGVGSNDPACVKALGSKEKLDGLVEAKKALGYLEYQSGDSVFSCTSSVLNKNDDILTLIVPRHCLKASDKGIPKKDSFRFKVASNNGYKKYQIGNPIIYPELEKIASNSAIKEDDRNWLLDFFDFRANQLDKSCKRLRFSVKDRKDENVKTYCYQLGELGIIKFKAPSVSAISELPTMTKITSIYSKFDQLNKDITYLQNYHNLVKQNQDWQELKKHFPESSNRVTEILNQYSTGELGEKLPSEIEALQKELKESMDYYWKDRLKIDDSFRFLANFKFHSDTFSYLLPKAIDSKAFPDGRSENKNIDLEIKVDDASHTVMFVVRKKEGEENFPILFNESDSGAMLENDRFIFGILSMVDKDFTRQAATVANESNLENQVVIVPIDNGTPPEDVEQIVTVENTNTRTTQKETKVDSGLLSAFVDGLVEKAKETTPKNVQPVVEVDSEVLKQYVISSPRGGQKPRRNERVEESETKTPEKEEPEQSYVVEKRQTSAVTPYYTDSNQVAEDNPNLAACN